MKNTKVAVNCTLCGKEYQIPRSQITYREKKGYKNHFCSRSCSSRHYWGCGISGKEADELSPFRVLLGHTKYSNRGRHAKYKTHNITIEYLHDLWNSQDGKCAITGIPMVLTKWHTKGNTLWNQASIDRIDGNKGYEIDNVRIVCLMANYCRNGFTDEEVINFCKLAAENHYINSPIYSSY